MTETDALAQVAKNNETQRYNNYKYDRRRASKEKRIFPEWTPFTPHSGSRSKDMRGHVFSNGSKILAQGERDSSGASTFYVECKVPGCSNVSRTRAGDLRKNISDKIIISASFMVGMLNA